MSDSIERIRAYAAEHPDATVTEIAQNLEMTYGTVRRVALANGIVTGEGNRNAMRADKVGRVCRACGSINVKVVDSRPSSFDSVPSVRRLRRCRDCDNRWTTHELDADVLEERLNPAAVRKSVLRNILRTLIEMDDP